MQGQVVLYALRPPIKTKGCIGNGSVSGTVSRSSLLSLINNYANKIKSNVYPYGAFHDISFSNDSFSFQINYLDL